MTNKVLITGGAGYIGSVVARHLLRLGYHVRVLDSLLYGGNSLLGLYSEDKFEFVRGDIRDKEIASQALLGMDGIVHLAAIVGDPACQLYSDEAVKTNWDSTKWLLNKCIEINATGGSTVDVTITSP